MTATSPRLAAIRITIFSKSGNPYHFNLFHITGSSTLLSSCQRVMVVPHRVEHNEKIVTVGDQYHVFVNEKPVPDHQFTILRSARPKQAGKHRPACKNPLTEKECRKRGVMNR